MTKLPPQLRKAAVLISALDERSAEALLSQMTADESAKVRSALVELDDITPHEQQQALADFLRQQGAPALAAASEDDVSLELTEPPADEGRTRPPAAVQPAAVPPREGQEPPLAFLNLVAAEPLARHLAREMPQTIAAVLAHLSAEQAAGVLERLPPALATAALERLAWLEPLAPEVLADLAAHLRQQLRPHLQAAAAESDSLARLAAVLGVMEAQHRQRVLAQLQKTNAALVERLGLNTTRAPAAVPAQVSAFRYRLQTADRPSVPPPERRAGTMRAARPAAVAADDSDASLVAFEDLSLLGDAALRAVFAAAGPDVVLLALTGADDRLVSRILRQLPAAAAAVLSQRLAQPGPIRLREIDAAQAELARIASQLAREGAIALPASVRFAAAV